MKNNNPNANRTQFPRIGGTADGSSRPTHTASESQFKPQPPQLHRPTATGTSSHHADNMQSSSVSSAAPARLLARPKMEKTRVPVPNINPNVAPGDLGPHPPEGPKLAHMCDRTNRLTVNLAAQRPRSRCGPTKSKQQGLTYLEKATFKPGLPDIVAMDESNVRLKPLLQPVHNAPLSSDVKLPAIKTHGYHQEPMKPIPRVAPIIPYGNPEQFNNVNLTTLDMVESDSSDLLTYVPKPPVKLLDVNDMPGGGAGVQERRKRRNVRRQ